ncbi:single-stranded DNA-binding protein [Brevundimonas lutea]|uniref:single-stranded DNA-binding protein n=1 Tax=Brevundimonas lutea TaxID=2293980 RepID=UPI001F0BFA8A|nr:hypothetical protein [Brevundimonas lutea]
MQTMVFTGRLAADPQISDEFGKAIFRLIEKRGVDAAGKDRLVGVNCVSWSSGLNEKVIARGMAQGCEAVVTGVFVDTAYETRDGQARTAKELVVNRLTLLDWAEDRRADGARSGQEDDGETPPVSDPTPETQTASTRKPRRAARAA